MVRGLDGEAHAYRQLLTELRRYFRSYFERRLTTADVEDLVQETLLAVHLKRDSYDRSLPFTPWAYAVARYKLADHFRRIPASHLPLEDAADRFTLDSSDDSAVRADLAQLLNRLPARQRSLIEEVKLKGWSVEEAARRSGVTAVSARVMLHRSLRWLTQSVGLEDQ
ncbi:MAG: sigma-70 family RNA polymerase sigma factor [Rhizomicrobium sp.]